MIIDSGRSSLTPGCSGGEHCGQEEAGSSADSIAAGTLLSEGLFALLLFESLDTFQGSGACD